MNIIGIAEGVALCGVAWFVYLAATKGLPYAWTKLKTWWSADVAAVKSGLAGAESRLTAVEADVKALKTKVGL
jgi:hypothetical protein